LAKPGILFFTRVQALLEDPCKKQKPPVA